LFAERALYYTYTVTVKTWDWSLCGLFRPNEIFRKHEDPVGVKQAVGVLVLCFCCNCICISLRDLSSSTLL